MVSYLVDKGTYASDLFSVVEMDSVYMDRPWSLRGKKGIYCFVLKEDFTFSYEQTKDWSNNIRGAGFREWGQKFCASDAAFYIGSSFSCSVYERIGQHINGKGNYSSLNLEHKKRQFVKNKLKIHCFYIDDCFSKEELKIILTHIEKGLHERLKPYVGSSRT